MTTTFEDVTKIAVPKATRTYAPVPNEDLVEGIREHVKSFHLNIVGERYQLGDKGQQMFGVMVLEPEKMEDKVTKDINFGNSHFTGLIREDMRRALGFRNSYNKSLPVGLVGGSNVTICSNLMFEGEIKKLRKHTINIYQDLDNLVLDMLLSLDKEFAKICESVEEYEGVSLNKKEAAQLCGRMFVEESIINSTQLNIIKRNWEEKEKEGGEIQTGWDFMNHCTNSLNNAMPREKMERQINLNSFLKRELIGDDSGIFYN